MRKRMMWLCMFALLVSFMPIKPAYAYEAVKKTLAPTAFAIRDADGKLIGESSRVQNYFNEFSGSMGTYDTDTIRLERGTTYTLEAVLSYYAKSGSTYTTERSLGIGVYGNDPLGEEILDPVSFYPVGTVKLSDLKQSQAIDGKDSGSMKCDGANRTNSTPFGDYTYTGAAFRADNFTITDEMPDEGHIYVYVPNSYKENGDDETFADDYLYIDYTTLDDPVPEGTEPVVFSDSFNEDGINMLIIDMLSASREENKENYGEIAVKERYDESSQYYVASEDKVYDKALLSEITYKNGITVHYNNLYGAVSLELPASAVTDPKRVFTKAPAYSEFPGGMRSDKLEEKARQYAESLGYVRGNTYENTYGYYYGSLFFYNRSQFCVTLKLLGISDQYQFTVFRSHS